MVKYEYKNTGIEWLGNIPKHWKFTPLKKEYTITPSNVDKKSNDDEIEVILCNYVDVYYNDFLDSSIEYMTATATEGEIDKFTLAVNDVLITKDSEDPYDIAVPAIITEIQDKFLCGYHLSILRSTNNKIDGRYLFWSLKDEAIASQLYREATGVTRWAIASRHIKNSTIPFPPLPEQKAIAEYLDKACQRIDSIIGIKQRQLESIEGYLGRKIDEIILRGIKDFAKKDSRKDFIGEIPTHYKVHKLKHITKQITDGTHSTPNYLDSPSESSIPFLRVTDVQTEKIELESVKYIELDEHQELIKRCKPEKGDLLLSKNGTIGITKIVDWDWEFSIFVSLALIKPDRLIDVEYLNYYFESDIMAYQMQQGSKQITVTNLHLDKIRDFYIVTPPVIEQKQLVEKIKLIEQKVISTKKNIENQITTLQSYRKSLIHECVTGKKQVWEDETGKVK